MSLLTANGKAIADILAQLVDLEQNHTRAAVMAVAWHAVANILNHEEQMAAARHLSERLGETEAAGDIDKHGPEQAAIIAKGRCLRAAARYKSHIRDREYALNYLKVNL